MRKYKLFQDEVLGYGFDIDGWFSWQCWDGYAKYCLWLGVPFANCTASGYVKDIWEQRHTNGMLDHFDEVEEMEAGDVAVFMETDLTPVSHIAIFAGDIDGTQGWFLGQNQGGAPGPDGIGGVFNLVAFPYSILYPTAFRPKGESLPKAELKETITEVMENHEAPFFPEDATFTVGDSPINVRRTPSLDGEIVAVYQPGEKVHYDSKGSNDGYRWISYVGESGNRNYLAIGQTDEAGNRIDLWGQLS